MPTQTGLLLPYQGTLPTVAADAWVAPGAVVIGDTEIGAEAGIWFGCVLRGDVNRIRVGARSNLQDGTVVHVNRITHPCLIGADVTVGHQALIHACTLEDGSFVGMGATVLDGAVVESGAMVAAGALVTPNKRVPRGELWSGRPARKMRDLTDEDYAGWRDTVAHYAKLAREYRAALAAS